MATADDHYLEGEGSVAEALALCDEADETGRPVSTRAIRCLLRYSLECQERGHRARRATNKAKAPLGRVA